MSGIRNEYENLGVDNFYKEKAETYYNPHSPIIEELLVNNESLYKNKKVLDLCCGSGEVSKIIKDDAWKVIGLDPYMNEVYMKATALRCYNYSFKDILDGKLEEQFDVIICSFALHLCEQSMLPMVLWQLSRIARELVVITPHKRPDCNIMGWEETYTEKLKKVTLKQYKHKETPY